MNEIQKQKHSAAKIPAVPSSFSILGLGPIQTGICAAFLLASLPTRSQTFDVATDFSVSSNPNGAWSYGTTGTTLNGAFTPFTVHLSDNGWHGGIFQWGYFFPHVTNGKINQNSDAGQVSLHPDPVGAFAVVRFTAPADGSYSLTTTFRGVDERGATSDAHVLLNGSPVFSTWIQGFGNASASSFSGSLALHMGDKIDFSVGWGSNNEFSVDLTALEATLQRVAVPEPRAYAASIALALVGFGIWRRKRS